MKAMPERIDLRKEADTVDLTTGEDEFTVFETDGRTNIKNEKAGGVTNIVLAMCFSFARK